MIVRFIIIVFVPISVGMFLINLFDPPKFVGILAGMLALIWLGFGAPAVLLKREEYSRDSQVSAFAIFRKTFGFWLLMISVAVALTGAFFFLAYAEISGLIGVGFGAILVFVLAKWIGQVGSKENEGIDTDNTLSKGNRQHQTRLSLGSSISQQTSAEPLYYGNDGSYVAFNEALSKFEKSILTQLKLSFGFDLSHELYQIDPANFEEHWLGNIFSGVVLLYKQEENGHIKAADFLFYRYCKYHPQRASIRSLALDNLPKIARAQTTEKKMQVDKLIMEFRELQASGRG